MSQLQVTGEAKIRDIQGPVVANSGVVTALDGAASQYVRGDGTLADFPTSTGGGSSVSYYLNSSVSQGTIGGVAYRELNREPIIGAGTDITISANGYVASYITDANDPDLLSVPGGNFNCEFYFSVDSNAHNPSFYAELYKYDGTTFTLLGTSVAVPEFITQGTTIAPYYFAIPVATAALALTDRLAIRIYVDVDGRTVTLHTENGHLCQVVTTFSKGMISLNNLTDQSQYLATGTSGTDFNIVSSGDTHTFNIPSASDSNRGLITTGSQTIAGSKTFTNNVNLNRGALIDSGYALSWSPNEYIEGSSVSNSLKFATSGLYRLELNSTGIFRLNAYTTNGLLKTSSSNGTFAIATPSTDYVIPSDLASYVPYTGATANVDLGINSILAFGFSAEGSGAVSGSISLKQNGSLFAGSGYATIGSTAVNKLNLYFGDASLRSVILDNSLLTANRTFNFPDASGTIALTSSLSGYVPYTGATANVDLGLYSLFAYDLFANGNGTNNANLYLKQGTASLLIQNGYSNILATGTKIGFQVATSAIAAYYADFQFSSLTAQRTFTLPDLSGTLALLEGSQTFSGTKRFDSGLLLKEGIFTSAVGYTAVCGEADGLNIITRVGATAYNNSVLFTNATSNTFTFPNASGTIALTSDLGAYLPLTGGTLTGALSGTSATFGGLLTINVPTDNTTVGIFHAGGGTANRGLKISTFVSVNDNAGVRLDAQTTVGGAKLTLATAGTDRLTIDATGAATFSSNLTLSSSSSTTDLGGVLIVRGNGSAHTTHYLTTGAANVAKYIQYNASGTAINLIDAGGVSYFNGGNVGIGTSSPASGRKLTVAGGAQFTGGDNSGASFNIIPAASGENGADFNLSYYTGTNYGPLTFTLGGSERMRITSGGYLKAAPNAGYGTSATYHELRNNINARAAIIVNDSSTLSTENGLSIIFNAASPNNTSSKFFDCEDTTNSKFIIYSNGSVVNRTGSYGTISDVKLKENIVDTTPKLQDLLKVKIRNYNLTGEESKYIGVIAQELEEIFPSMIDETEDFEEVEVKSEDGNVTTEKKSLGTTTKSVKYSVFVPMLIKAIQEQQAQIEELKALINK